MLLPLKLWGGEEYLVHILGLPLKKKCTFYMVKGLSAERIIPQITLAASTYPYQYKYCAWPGPNSNIFISYIFRNISGITVELPPNAIGKEYLVNDYFFLKRRRNQVGNSRCMYYLD